MKRNWLVPLIGIVLVAGLATGLGVSQPWQSPQSAPRTAAAPISQTTCVFSGVQSVTITGSPTGGTWQLSFGPNLSPTIALTDTASTITSDIVGLNFILPSGGTGTVASGQVNVTGSVGGPFTVTFSGAIFNQVPRLLSANTFTGGTAPGVAVAIVPHDQTHQLQNLINTSPNNSTLTLPANSCWEVDGNLPAGTLTGALAGALTTSLFTTIGTLTSTLSTVTNTTSLPVTTSGSVTIPSSSNIFLTQVVGGVTHRQTFVSVGPTTAGSPSITVASQLATFAYGGTATVQWGSLVTTLNVTTTGFQTINTGDSVQVQDQVTNTTQTFTALSGPYAPNSTSILVNAQVVNFPYAAGAGGAIASPKILTLPVTGSAWDLPVGSKIDVANEPSEANTQTFTTTVDAPPGTTSLTVTGTQFANFHYAVGSLATRTNNSLHISGNTNLTVNGNGASLVQTVCQTDAFITQLPIVFVTQNNGLTLENLSITGAIGWPHAGCGANGPEYEKAAGIIAEGETNLTITHVGIFNEQGDGIQLQLPVDFGGIPGTPVNTNVVISNSVINPGNGGYHCLVVESVGPTPTYPNGGAKIVNNTWTNCATEFADFEVDDEQSSFGSSGCNLIGGLCPLAAAQTNVLIANNNISHWCGPLLASLQGSGNGVQEQNLQITGNTLKNNGCPASPHAGSLFDVSVAPPAGNKPGFWTYNWLIANNNMVGGAFSTQSAGCGGGGFVHPVMDFSGVVNVTITDNIFPIDYGNETFGCPGNPYLAALEPANNTNLVTTNNMFLGGLQILTNGGGNTPQPPKHCNNTFGAAGTLTPVQTDPAC